MAAKGIRTQALSIASLAFYHWDTALHTSVIHHVSHNISYNEYTLMAFPEAV